MSYTATPLAILRAAIGTARRRTRATGLKHHRKAQVHSPAKLAQFAAFREAHGITLGPRKIWLGGGRGGRAPSMPTFNLPPMPED